MKDFLVNRKKEIILVSILLVFAVILVIVIINKDKIDFASLMGNSTISSEYEYYCEDGWELINDSGKNICIKWVGDVIESDLVEYYCPEGYEQSGDKCIKITGMIENNICPEGTDFVVTCAGCPIYCQKIEIKDAKKRNVKISKSSPY